MFNILHAELNRTTDNKDILQIVVKALNNTVSLNRLVLTLFIFSTYPRINTNSPLLLDIT
jgi:hypothetical protein